MKMRGERWGGVVWRLMKKRENRDRGVMGKGKDGLEMTPCRGNKVGKMEKDGRGRVEARGEPSVVASEQTGLMDQMTWNRL
jgi:membrane protein implicated in regulation of membrane protease activity